MVPAGGAGPPIGQLDGAASGIPAAGQLIPLGHPPEECSTGVAGEAAVVSPGLGHLHIADTATAHSVIISC